MRRQYHFRKSGDDTLIWDVHRLVELSANLPVKEVSLESIRELDEPFWFGDDAPSPTCRAIAEHARLIEETDLAFPIILSRDGRVMDGMHRVARAFIKGHTRIKAVQFAEDPCPDCMNVHPDDLAYDEISA